MLTLSVRPTPLKVKFLDITSHIRGKHSSGLVCFQEVGYTADLPLTWCMSETPRRPRLTLNGVDHSYLHHLAFMLGCMWCDQNSLVINLNLLHRNWTEAFTPNQLPCAIGLMRFCMCMISKFTHVPKHEKGMWFAQVGSDEIKAVPFMLNQVLATISILTGAQDLFFFFIKI